MFTKSNITKQSFSKSFNKHGRSSSSFTKDAGISKRRHEPRRRPTTATSASTAESASASARR